MGTVLTKINKKHFAQAIMLCVITVRLSQFFMQVAHSSKNVLQTVLTSISCWQSKNKPTNTDAPQKMMKCGINCRSIHVV